MYAFSQLFELLTRSLIHIHTSRFGLIAQIQTIFHSREKEFRVEHIRKEQARVLSVHESPENISVIGAKTLLQYWVIYDFREKPIYAEQRTGKNSAVHNEETGNMAQMTCVLVIIRLHDEWMIPKIIHVVQHFDSIRNEILISPLLSRNMASLCFLSYRVVKNHSSKLCAMAFLTSLTRSANSSFS